MRITTICSITLLIGFLIAVLQNYVGNKDRMQEMIFIYPPHCYHIHHYIYFMVIALFLFIGHYVRNSKIVYGIVFLLIGFSLEDLLYLDIFKIKDNCHNTKLIKILEKYKGT